MYIYKADLHLHTCLSPCGGYDVTPTEVVRRAAKLGIDIIAITDHNSVENVAPVLKAARRLGNKAPLVLPGLEITTAEEAHLLAIFGDLGSALTMQAMVYGHLQGGPNTPDIFGQQIVANVDDEVEEFNPRLLIGATDLPVHMVVRRIHGLGGLAIACHIDRQSYSIIGQLGMIPKDLDLDAVEISWRSEIDNGQILLMGRDLPIITSSDAHILDDLGRVWTELILITASFTELDLALKGHGNRGVVKLGKRK